MSGYEVEVRCSVDYLMWFLTWFLYFFFSKLQRTWKAQFFWICNLIYFVCYIGCFELSTAFNVIDMDIYANLFCVIEVVFDQIQLFPYMCCIFSSDLRVNTHFSTQKIPIYYVD